MNTIKQLFQKMPQDPGIGITSSACFHHVAHIALCSSDCDVLTPLLYHSTLKKEASCLFIY